MNLEHFRVETERKIVSAVIESALSAGYIIGVDNGDGAEFKSKDKAKILKAMFRTDEDTLFLYRYCKARHACGWVKFIYGNSGYDVIHDYTSTHEPLLSEAWKISDAAEKVLS